MKKCRVSFRAWDDVVHSCEVEAETLYEAVGFGLARFKKAALLEHVQAASCTELTVEVREPAVIHTVARKKFDDWLERKGGRNPKESLAYRRVREALGLPAD